MKITNVNITKTDTMPIKARISITVDEAIIVHNITISEDANGNLYVNMPSKKTPDGSYLNIIHPINQETRKQINDTLITIYKAMS